MSNLRARRSDGSPEREASCAQPPKRVLCVEDNEDIGFLLYNALKREGFEPVITYTVRDALMPAGREDFDPYVLDVALESGSGLDLCRTPREARP